MKKKPIIFRILIRYLKEKGIFNEYKHFFSNRTLNNALYEIKSDRTSLLLYPFRIESNNAKTINSFFTNPSHEIEFNKIICYYLRDYAKLFLIQNGIYDDFVKNRKIYLEKTNTNAIYKDNNDLIDDYIDRLAKSNYSMKNFIFNAFSWFYGCNSGLWSTMHHKYVQYVLKILTE